MKSLLLGKLIIIIAFAIAVWGQHSHKDPEEIEHSKRGTEESNCSCKPLSNQKYSKCKSYLVGIYYFKYVKKSRSKGKEKRILIILCVIYLVRMTKIFFQSIFQVEMSHIYTTLLQMWFPKMEQ